MQASLGCREHGPHAAPRVPPTWQAASRLARCPASHATQRVARARGSSQGRRLRAVHPVGHVSLGAGSARRWGRVVATLSRVGAGGSGNGVRAVAQQRREALAAATHKHQKPACNPGTPRSRPQKAPCEPARAPPTRGSPKPRPGREDSAHEPQQPIRSRCRASRLPHITYTEAIREALTPSPSARALAVASSSP